MSSPLVLSNNFIRKALTENISLSPMKLQKLIYFTFRDYLKKYNIPLFLEPICAWKYGPVVESVYNHFKSFEANSIDKFYRDAVGKVLIFVESPDGFGNVINFVWSKYRYYSGMELSKITHRDGTAWYKAWIQNEPYLNLLNIKNEELTKIA